MPPFSPEFRGVDPDRLLAMIQSMDADASALRAFVQRFRGEFARLGVDTSALTELEQISAWAQDQLPVMRRRYDLAMAANRLGGAGFVQIPEVRMSLAEAYAKGRNLASMFGTGILGNSDFSAALKGELVHQHVGELTELAGDADASAAFVAALPAQLRQALPHLLVETGSSTAREDLAAFSAVFGAALRATQPPARMAEYERELTAPASPAVAWQRLALLRGSDAPPEVLAGAARLVLDEFAARPARNWRGVEVPEARAYGLPRDSVALALRVIADDPVAVRSVFAEMGRPEVELTRPERMNLLFKYAQQGDDDIADALGRALATGSGIHEQPGAHSADAASFAFDTIVTVASFGQDIPHTAQDSMAELAASYQHELLASAIIDDGASRTSSMTAPPHFSTIPGLTPGFYLSPRDTYGFLKTFVADERSTDRFDQAMGELRRNLLVEAARLDGEAIQGDPPKDPGYFKVMASAIGDLMGVEYAAALKVRGDMDAFDERMRGIIADPASVMLNVLPGPDPEKTARWFGWQAGMFATGKNLDSWEEGDQANTRVGKLDSERDQWMLAQRYEIATRLWEGGYPADPPWPTTLMKDGKPLPLDYLLRDSKEFEMFEAWSDSTDKAGDGSTFDKKIEEGTDGATSSLSAVTAKDYEN
ncbi:hypothetical protein GCM10009555_034500 [Acrocarpospora macrocephala]|uniref:Uncharacterized protein n=1 Tax=Acrocarpospora macrocephala TaxID=150177 RepID=A0A5M3WHM6_9ACTN|nr:hypothetical protein [Acrocarpospora macrocephala]GES06631.1 hypothetical protein Amac_002260 [Acrocarpospora macrocephala]